MNATAEHWNGPIRERPGGDGRRSVKSLLGVALGTLASLALLASAGFFHVAIQRDEMVTAQCMRAVDSIRSTQMLAAQWSIEVGKVKNEVNSNFDVLADFADRMSPHIQVIHDSQSAMPDLPSDIRWALNGYVQRLKAREERIERFKSGFAIVRNSRRIIPREGALLAEAARGGGHRRVEAATRQIIEWTASFLRQPTEVRHQRLEQAARTLAESAADTPLRNQAETLNKHVGALLQHHVLTEQRFEDVMRTDLEDRAERVIGLLDADHQQSRTKRRYFDYGFWVSLGLALFYWATLVVRWAGRRKGKVASGAPEAAPAEGPPSLWGMDVALATADGPGFPLEDAQGPGRGGGERPEQSRSAAVASAQRPGRRPEAAPAFRGEAAPSLEERLRARDGRARRTRQDEAGREDVRERGAGREVSVHGKEDTPGRGPEEPSLEERLKALKAEMEVRKQARRGGSVPGDAGDTGDTTGEPDAFVAEDREPPSNAFPDVRTSPVPDGRLKAEVGARRAQEPPPPSVPDDAPEQEGAGATEGERGQAHADGGPGRFEEPSLEERLKALKAEMEARKQARRGGSVPGDAGDTGDTTGEPDAFVAEDREPPSNAFPDVRTNPVPDGRLKAGAGARRAQEPPPPSVPDDAPEQEGAGVTEGERGQAHADGGPGRFPAMAKEDVRAAGPIRADVRSPQAQARARAAEPEVETAAAVRARTGAPGDGVPGRGGKELRLRDREAEEASPPSPPDGSEFVHRATREAMLDRLREVEQEIRAATAAAEQAERLRRDADGEGHRDTAWAAAAGRMAGARWAVHTLLREVDRLPAAPSPRGSLGRVDLRALLEKQLGALPGEDRRRVDATLVPGAVARGNPRALETAADLIVKHALEGARLHPGGEGYVTLTLVQEDDGVHLTCLDHGPEGAGSGERRSLALAVAQGLIEGQDGEMEITPYPRHGTMVRLRLPPSRTPV